MTLTTAGEHRKYISNARKALDVLEGRIAKLRERRAGEQHKSGAEPVRLPDAGWEETFNQLQTRAAEIGGYLEALGEKARHVDAAAVGDRLEEMTKSGEKRVADLLDAGERSLTDLQTRAETGFWNLRAMVQRASEGVRPLLHIGEAPDKARYYLQKARNGRWALVRNGADSPTLFFDSKTEGLKASRRYVREHSPSELVVRRRDGTFEKVHSYPG